MAGEFLVKNFGVKTKDEENKKGSFLLDNFKIDPTPVKPADVFLPTADFKTGGMAKENAAPLSMPASKAGAHRVRNTSFNSDPKSNTPQTYGPVQTTKEDALSAGRYEPFKLHLDYKTSPQAVRYYDIPDEQLSDDQVLEKYQAILLDTDMERSRKNKLLKQGKKRVADIAYQLSRGNSDGGKDDIKRFQLAAQIRDEIDRNSLLGSFAIGLFNSASFNQLENPAIASGIMNQFNTDPAILEETLSGLKQANTTAKQAHPVSYGMGQFAGEAAKYKVAGDIVGGIPGLNKAVSAAGQKLSQVLGGSAAPTVGNAASPLLGGALPAGIGGALTSDLMTRLVSGRMVDLPVDTLNAATQNDNVKDFGKQLAADTALGLGTDIGIEAIGAGIKTAGRKIKESWMKDDPILQSLDWNKSVDKTVNGSYNQVGGELNGTEVAAGQNLDSGGTERSHNQVSGAMVGRQGGPRKSSTQTGGTFGSTAPSTREISEPAGTFIARANQEGRIVEADDFGNILSYRPAENIGENAATARAILSRRGFDNFAYEGTFSRNKNGLTVEHLTDAQTLADGRIGIKDDCTLPGAEIAGHEGFHSITVTAPEVAEPFLNLIANPRNPEKVAQFQDIQDHIGDLIFKDSYDPSDKSQRDKIIKELAAQFGGKADNNLEEARAIFNYYLDDFDAAYAMWKKVNADFDSMKSGGPGGRNLLDDFQIKKAPPTLPESDPILQSLSWKDVPEDFDTLGAMRTAKRPGDLTFDLEPGEVERGFSQNIRSDRNMPNEIRQSFGEDPLLYKQIGNPTTLKKANEIISEYGYEGARAELYKMLGQNVPNPESVPLAKLLARQANELGDIQAARRMLAEVADKLTQAGQFTQAARILREADAETVITTLDKQLKRLNEQGRKQYKKKWKDFDLTPDELNQIRKIKPGDEQAVAAAMENVRSRIADQMPASMGEKFDAWRKMAMLLNPVTHIRNVTSNAFMTTLDKTSSRLSGLMQKLLPKAKRTRAAVVGREYKQLAKEVFDNNAKDLLEQSSRFDELRIHMPDRRIFNSVLPQEFTIGGHKIYNPVSLENIRKFSYASLEAGDTPFFKLAYVDRLASYMQAKGIKDINAIPQEGFDLALRGAQEATFKDPSKIASWIAKSKQTPGIGRAVDTVLPFSKTPVAIANRGMEYSPLGLVQSLYKAVSGQGAAEALDKMAKGLTGSALFGLGMLLYDSGVITAGISADKDKREFEKSVGISPYSILGKFSYDWAQPFAIPIAAGAATMKSLQENNVDTQVLIDQMLHAESAEDFIRSFGIAVDEIPGFTAAKAGMDVLLDQPLLQAAQEFSGRMGTGVSDAIFGLPGQYVEQMIPSVMNRIAGFADPTIRATKDTSGLSTFYNTVRAKTPGISASLPEKRDVWGEIQTRVTDPKLRFLQQFVSPSNLNVQSASPLDEEIMRLYDTTGSSGVFPSYKNKPFSFTTGDGVYEVGYRELPEYQEIFGTTARQISENLMAEELYQKAQEDRKAYLLEQAYKYADAVAKAQISGTSLEGWVKEANEAQKAGIPLDTYLIQREKYSSLPTDETAKSQRYREMLLNDNTLTAKQKAELDKRLIGSKTTPDYTNADTFQFSFLTDAEKSAYAALQASNMDMSTFLWLEDGLKDVKGSKDRNGKTISGSLKQNRYDKLIRMGVTPQEASYYLKVRYNYKE